MQEDSLAATAKSLKLKQFPHTLRCVQQQGSARLSKLKRVRNDLEQVQGPSKGKANFRLTSSPEQPQESTRNPTRNPTQFGEFPKNVRQIYSYKRLQGQLSVRGDHYKINDYHMATDTSR